MVDPKELRIGNAFTLPHQKYHLIVRGIDPYGRVFYSVGGKIQYLYLSIKDIEPIPLTPEWLKRLGGKYEEWKSFSLRFPSSNNRIEKGYVFNDVYCFIYHGLKKPRFFGRRRTSELDDKRERWEFNEYTQPRYVHEFQNLFFDIAHQELKINP